MQDVHGKKKQTTGPIGAGRKGKTLSRSLLCSALGLGLPLLGCREIGPSWVTLGLNWVLDLGPSTYNKYKENTKNKNKTQ